MSWRTKIHGTKNAGKTEPTLAALAAQGRGVIVHTANQAPPAPPAAEPPRARTYTHTDALAPTSWGPWDLAPTPAAPVASPPDLRKEAQEGSVSQVDAQVRYIMLLMSTGAWTRGKDGTVASLAAEFQVSRSRVEHLAAEASRRLDSAVGDRALVTQHLQKRLIQLMDDAMSEGDRKNANKSIELMARIIGAFAPEKFDVTAKRFDIETMPAEEVRARLRAMAETFGRTPADETGDVEIVDAPAPAETDTPAD